ncbi:MAG TPA: response regulator [Actinocrinis sp.]|nr:response regulator [Actinocrinis sp.]
MNRAARDPFARPAHAATGPLGAPGARTILLVEDDEADALLIREALDQAGCERTVTQVGDGIEALAHLRDPARPRPDLIVLDLNMPRMGGRELLGILKADESLRLVPTVVLTSSKAPDDIAAAYARHANAFVTKPIDLEDFNVAVRGIDAFFLDIASGVES